MTEFRLFSGVDDASFTRQDTLPVVTDGDRRPTSDGRHWAVTDGFPRNFAVRRRLIGMASDAVLLDVSDGGARVTLNRPDARNAISATLADELVAAFDTVADSDARCVVVEGAGSAFSAGGDVQAMLDGIDSDVPVAERVELVIRSANRAVRRAYECQIPTVALTRRSAW